MHKDCILGIYNTWGEIAHIKDQLYKHPNVIPWHLYLKDLVKLGFVVNIWSIACKEVHYVITELW